MHVYDRIRRCSFLSFDLSGLHWHLSGLSVLPLEQRPLVLLAGEPFPFASLFFRRRAFRFDLFVFVLSVCFYTYEHVVVEHLAQTQLNTTHRN